MPVHIEEMSSEVTVLNGDNPLTEAQMEQLARIVMRRIEEKQRGEKLRSAAAAIGTGAAPGRE